MKKLYLISSLILLSGCMATISPDAQKVVLHTQLSTVLSDCKKLGVVVGEDSGYTDLNVKRQQAINNMREKAFTEFQGDTVVLINVDQIGGLLEPKKFVAQGMAYKCNN